MEVLPLKTSLSLLTSAGSWKRQESCSPADMSFLWALLVTLGELGAVTVLLFLAWATHFYLSHAEIPHGVCQPHKLKIILFVLIVSSGMDYIFWKLGCWRRYALNDFLLAVVRTSFSWKSAKLSTRDFRIHDVPVRLYQPKSAHPARKGVIYIHGGGGSVGSIAGYENVCRHIASESNATVLSIGYSLPHQRPQPAQFQECLDVSIYFMEHAKDFGVDPARVAIMGDSFGGLLTASVCQMIAQRDDSPKPCAQILVYPCLQFVTFSLPSHMQNASAPPLFRKQVLVFALQYLHKNVPLVDIIADGHHFSKDLKMKYEKWLSPENIPAEFKVRERKAPVSTSQFGDVLEFMDLLCEKLFNPLLADDAIIRQVPKMLLLTAQYDVFRDDGVLYKKRLEDNGVPVSWCHLEDGFHGVVGLINDPLLASPCTKRGMDRLVNYIRDL